MDSVVKKKTFKDIAFVAFSNIISILCSLLTGFLVPKILGVQEYGYFKTFTLYAGYVGLFHFGFCDGIQLIYAGKKPEELNKADFIAYTRFLIIVEAIISSIIAVIALTFLDGNLKFIFACVALDLILQNVMTYYQYILQCTSQFKEYSLKNIAYSFLLGACILSLWFIYKYSSQATITFQIYVLILISIYMLMVIWFVIRFRSITFGKATLFKNAIPGIKKCFKFGFPLLVANLCSGLILNFDTQFVNIFFPNAIYAVYAFAYSVLGMVAKLISAVTIVIYPTLKQTQIDQLKELFPKITSLLVVFVSGCMSFYFLLVPLVNSFLPDYSDSLIIFRIILPGLLLSSVVSVIIQNYYKAVNKPGIFFIFSAITLAISVGLNFVAYYLFKTTTSISWASIVTLLIYYFLTLIPLIKEMGIKWLKNSSYLLLIISCFYLCFLIKTLWVGFLAYFSSFLLLSLVFYLRDIKTFIAKSKKRLNKS